MSQQNIDFGTFPDDPDADAIRTAFAKAQNNFTELFATTTAGSVASINGGAGIAVNTPTGNVIVTANLAQVVVSTSSLSVGQGSNGGTTAVINSSIQTLVIDINPANVFSGNFSGVSSALANLNGTLTSNSNSQPNITSVGTLTSLAVTGNLTAGNVYANSGTIGAANLTGSLTTAAQGNITSVGVLTGLGVNGTVTAVAFTANSGLFTGDGGGLSNLSVAAGSLIVSGSSNVKVELNSNVNVTVAGVANVVTVTSTGSNVNGYLTVTGNVSSGNANLGNTATANYFIGNLYGHANTANTVTTNAQPNITSLGSLTSLDVTGNITSGNVYANSGIIKAQYLQGDGSNLTNLSAGIILVNGNSNVSIPTANGNINMSAVGNSNVVVITGTGVNVAGTINATGTITGNFSGNIITASQGNITSLGTLTGLTVNGTSNLGAVGNVKITGGSSNGYLFTDGTGNLTFGSIVNTPPGGANNDIQFKDGGTYQGSSNFTFNPTSNTVSIIGNLSVTSNANVGNLNATLLTGTLTTASNQQANIKLVGTLDYLIINTAGYLSMGSGNITAGNISLIAAGSANLGNLATANYFVGNGSALSELTFGNITTFATAGLTTDELYLQGTTRLNVSNSGSSGYLFDQYGATVNPPLYVTSGQTLAFNLNVTGHPFLIQTSAGANYSTGLVYVNTAGTVSTTTAAQGQIAGTLYWKIPYGITGNYKYQCSVHGGMNGNIVVTDANVANINVGSATTAGTLTTNAQPNITSVGTLTSLNASGNITAPSHIANTGYFIRSVSASVSAAGTVQGNATALTTEFNRVSTVTGGTGVVLPTAVAGMSIAIVNSSANSLLVYPATGAAINSLSTNVGYSHVTLATLQYIAISSTQWYTVGASYA